MSVLASCADVPRPLRPAPDAAAVQVLPRTPELATYPCGARCHAQRAPNPTPRALREFHAGRELHHGTTLRWCDFCHHEPDLDRLRLLSGETVSFDESHRVCGQCHGEKLRDWERGIHGSTTGSWSGVRQRRTCATCHDPHAPARPRFDPLPAATHDRAFPAGSH